MAGHSRPLRRHARPCAGHPRLNGRAKFKDVDGRDKPGHDELDLCPAMTRFVTGMTVEGFIAGMTIPFKMIKR
jgi:hypothetical protein